MKKLFKKEVYGIDVTRKDADNFVSVVKDLGFKVKDLGGEIVTTLEVEAEYKALKSLVNIFDWTGGVSGPYKR